jgi:hypothetical protein
VEVLAEAFFLNSRQKMFLLQRQENMKRQLTAAGLHFFILFFHVFLHNIF